MQRLRPGLKLHDFVPEGGHLGLNAVDRQQAATGADRQDIPFGR